MPQITCVHPDDRRGSVEVPLGVGVCVEEIGFGPLPKRGPVEDEVLDGTAAEHRPSGRLSCQPIMTAAVEGIVVRLPEARV